MGMLIPTFREKIKIILNFQLFYGQMINRYST